jgi:hypothetical protein
MEMSEWRTWRGAPGAPFAHLFPLGWGFVPNSETLAKPWGGLPGTIKGCENVR